MAASLAGNNMLRLFGSLLLSHLHKTFMECRMSFVRSRSQLSCAVIPQSTFLHTSRRHTADFDPEIKSKQQLKQERRKKFLEYNDVIYPPQKPGEPARPAEVCHMRANIRGHPKRKWYAAVMVRGLSVDEAIKQCDFHNQLFPHIIKEVIQEAQEIAVRDHNVEFKSNLWVADSYVTKGNVIKGMRLHARGRRGEVRFMFCNYYVRLREGTPPKHYYPPPPTGLQKMEEYIKLQRERRIKESL